MHRRSLMAGLGAAIAVAPAVAVGGVPRQNAALTSGNLYFSPVNESQRNACLTLETGQTFELARDASRRFDPLSIAVVNDGKLLGYLPGRPTRQLAALLDAGWAATGKLSNSSSVGHFPIEVELLPPLHDHL